MNNEIKLKLDKEEDAVLIQRAWLRSLIKYAETVEENYNKNNDIEPTYWLKFGIPSLLGYIASAKSILDED